MKKEIKIAIPVAVVISFVVVVSIFFSSDIVQETFQKESIDLIMNVWPGYAYAVIANEKEFFEDNGVLVNLDVVAEYPDMINRFLGGGYDGFFGVYSDVILLSNQGISLQVVYVFDYSNGADVIVSESQIATMADLKGKTISIEKFQSFSHLFLLELLKSNGLAESDVTFIEIPAHQVVAALDAGVIDAGHTWEPTQSKAIAKGYRILATSAEVEGIITDVLAFKKSVVEDRSEDVRKVVASFVKAYKFQETNKNATHAFMSDRLGISPGELKDALVGIHQLNLEENKAAFIASNELTSLYASGKLILNIFIEKEIITNPIDIEELIVPEIVNGIK